MPDAVPAGGGGGPAAQFEAVRTLSRSTASRPSTRPPVRVEWRLRRDGAGFKIVDVLVESVSMSITQRDDFSATIQRAGGRVEGLLAVLRDKVRTASN